MWGVMERLGYKSLLDELNGPKIHCLENMMTLAPGCRRILTNYDFGLLQLCVRARLG